MRIRVAHYLPAAVLFSLLLLALSLAAQQPYSQSDELAWRTQHAADLQKPDGWLSLIGLEWLEPGETSIGSAQDNKIHLPSTAPAHLAVLKLENNSVTLAPPAEGFPAGLQIDGAPAKQQPLRADQDKDKFNSHVTIGTLNFYVIKRSDKFALRIKDSKSPSLLEFHGLKWFEPNPEYHVMAKWTPYVPAKSVSLITLVGTEYSQSVPGYA